MTSGSTTLRRELGPVEVTASGVGIIIGAGIYVLLGAATAEAGAAVWASFAIAAGLCAVTGLSYAELASMYPTAGAEYDYTRRAFPEWGAFVVGWMMGIGLVVATAAIAVGFAKYLNFFVDVPVGPAAMTLVGIEWFIAGRGIRWSSRLTVALTLLQVGGLVAVIATGVPDIGTRSLGQGATVGGVFGGAALVFFAFIGFDEVITLSEETRNPTRTIPRALLLALGISAALYMAVAVAAVSVLGPAALAASDRPLADVMANVLGGSAEAAVAAIALLTTVNTSLLALTAGSRLLYGMAHSNALPRRLARVSPGTGAPTVAIGLTAVGAMAFAALGDLTLIASVTDFAVYVVFLAVNATVITLRLREPSTVRPFRTPGQIRGVPVLPIVGTAATVVMVPQLDGAALQLGVALTTVGAVVGVALRRSRSRPGPRTLALTGGQS